MTSSVYRRRNDPYYSGPLMLAMQRLRSARADRGSQEYGDALAEVARLTTPCCREGQTWKGPRTKKREG